MSLAIFPDDIVIGRRIVIFSIQLQTDSLILGDV